MAPWHNGLSSKKDGACRKLTSKTIEFFQEGTKKKANTS